MMFHTRTHSRRHRSGFTLIEAALVTAIIGFGVMAMLGLLAAGTVANSDGTETTMGLNLAKNVREMCLGLAYFDPAQPAHWGAENGETLATYNDLDDLDGQVFSPPIDARRQQLDNYAGWAQAVTVQSVDQDLLTSPVPNGSTPAMRVTVTVTHNGKTIYTLSWYQFDNNAG